MNGMACVMRSFAIASRKLVMSRKVQITRSCVNMTFIEEANKNKVAVEAKIGKSVLDIAIENNIDIEGACGGELACSTCHVILDQALFDKLPPKTEEEEDMLDLAWGLTDTSRLCCQLRVTKDLEGAVFKIPAETNNML
eukprot:CAMPEP_0184970342 /NCGR_PEP_ID=MMETSP1098-20130426/2867_1 /TAXON_ID=89044 /ORGANISM="Spumella elongata, Strain CCAP 955/1" /LENGTH=138 /DNA_ID=CAMNT_0027492277 /DNA_START=30 /DNA_END=446 /DNA_ORIENTATION=+